METYKADTLVMLSGGLDSTAMLYKLLTTEPERKLHVHHLSIQGWENNTKHLAEQAAVQNIIEYLADFDFVYSENAYQFDHRAFDQMVYYYHAACLAASDLNIKEVAIGRIKTDIEAEANQVISPTKAGRAIFEIVIETWPRRRGHRPQLIFPVEELNKQELIKLLPEELFKMTCSCRKPRIVQNILEICGRCRKCREIKNAKSNTRV